MQRQCAQATKTWWQCMNHGRDAPWVSPSLGLHEGLQHWPASVGPRRTKMLPASAIQPCVLSRPWRVALCACAGAGSRCRRAAHHGGGRVELITDEPADDVSTQHAPHPADIGAPERRRVGAGSNCGRCTAQRARRCVAHVETRNACAALESGSRNGTAAAAGSTATPAARRRRSRRRRRRRCRHSRRHRTVEVRQSGHRLKIPGIKQLAEALLEGFALGRDQRSLCASRAHVGGGRPITQLVERRPANRQRLLHQQRTLVAKAAARRIDHPREPAAREHLVERGLIGVAHRDAGGRQQGALRCTRCAARGTTVLDHAYDVVLHEHEQRRAYLCR